MAMVVKGGVLCLTPAPCLPAVPAVLLGDVGFEAAGKWGKGLVYGIIYTLDGTRCVILQLAATESLRHVFPEDSRPSLLLSAVIMGVCALALVQVRLAAPIPAGRLEGLSSV